MSSIKKQKLEAYGYLVEAIRLLEDEKEIAEVFVPTAFLWLTLFRFFNFSLETCYF